VCNLRTNKEEKSEFVRVVDVEKQNEKAAIEQATVVADSDDDETKALKKEINDNWDAIVPFYTGKGGRKDPKAIREDILDAHAAWKRRFGNSKETEGKTAADLSSRKSPHTQIRNHIETGSAHEKRLRSRMQQQGAGVAPAPSPAIYCAAFFAAEAAVGCFQ